MMIVSRLFPHPLFITQRILPEAAVYFSTIESIQSEPFEERSDRLDVTLYRSRIPVFDVF